MTLYLAEVGRYLVAALTLLLERGKKEVCGACESDIVQESRDCKADEG